MNRRDYQQAPQLIITFDNERDRDSAIKALARWEVNSKSCAGFNVQTVDYPWIATTERGDA